VDTRLFCESGGLGSLSGARKVLNFIALGARIIRPETYLCGCIWRFCCAGKCRGKIVGARSQQTPELIFLSVKKIDFNGPWRINNLFPRLRQQYAILKSALIKADNDLFRPEEFLESEIFWDKIC